MVVGRRGAVRGWARQRQGSDRAGAERAQAAAARGGGEAAATRHKADRAAARAVARAEGPLAAAVRASSALAAATARTRGLVLPRRGVSRACVCVRLRGGCVSPATAPSYRKLTDDPSADTQHAAPH